MEVVTWGGRDSEAAGLVYKKKVSDVFGGMRQFSTYRDLEAGGVSISEWEELSGGPNL